MGVDLVGLWGGGAVPVLVDEGWGRVRVGIGAVGCEEL